VDDPELPSVTRLLGAARGGDATALDRVFELLYAELKRMAAVVRRGRGSETLDTTSLVHEAYLKLLPSATIEWADRAHFFRVAARAMRQVLVDAAEYRMAQKRGGGAADVTLAEEIRSGRTVEAADLIDLDRAMRELAAEHARAAEVVEMRIFTGLSLEETAMALQVSQPTVTRDWRFARAWLSDRLDQRESA